MSAKIVSCLVLFVAGSLAGCGFKSDLFLPDEEDKGLFGRDTQTEPALPDESELNDLSNLVNSPFFQSGEGVDENLMLEKVTTVATEGEILIPSSVPDSQSVEGIPVDLTEVTREVESRLNN